MIEFILSNWKSIILIYALIGFAVFILIEIGWMWVIRMDDHDKEEFPEYYDDDEMGVGLALITGLIIGVVVGIFWLFVLVAIPFLMLMDWIQRKHPHLLGNMLEDMEERDSDRKNN
ncbi:MAG: hypothetical protein HDQ96_03605 [Lachnospiraceae bacterium]|nr:hypothetical protein [Lachnospiraceae bacterium]